MRPGATRLAALALGAAFALGQPPFDLRWVALAALAAVLWFAAAPLSARQTGWIGWSFGTGYFAVSLRWILEPFQVDAATTGWMAPFALVGLAAGLALFWALAFWLGRRLSPGIAGIASALAAVEMLRSYVLTGFPWGLVGYLWSDTPVAQWHSLIGPHGLTLATTLLAAALAAAARHRAIRTGGIAAVAAAVLWIGGILATPAPLPTDGRPIVRLVQPNAPQHQKWDPAYIPTFFNRQVDFTAQLPRADLIVWPETAVQTLLHNAEPVFDVIADAAAGTPVVLGIQREAAGRYYNSLVTLDETGEPHQLYDKHHLVPFGEYMPAASLFARYNILGLATRAEFGFSAGPGPRLLDLGDLGTALPLICYEAVFPQDVNAAPERPDMLLHLTNDAWFGTYAGPQQHLQQARLRAIEQRLPVVRAANTGISAMIDPAGRILDSLPLGRAGFIDVPLPAPLDASLYSRIGDFGALMALIVAFGWLTLINRRSGH